MVICQQAVSLWRNAAGIWVDATMLILCPELRGSSICRDFLEPLCDLPDVLQIQLWLFTSTQPIWEEMQQKLYHLTGATVLLLWPELHGGTISIYLEPACDLPDCLQIN